MTNFVLTPDIEQAAVDAVVALEGEPIRVEQWNHEASWDAVRHYALGLGDDNPLFCDPAYGEATPYGTLLAPPTYPTTAFDGAVGRGMPGVQPIYAGAEWTFVRRIRRGDRVVAASTFGPVTRKSGATASDLVIQSALSEYTDGEGRPLASSIQRTFRVARRGAGSGLGYEPRSAHALTDDELAAIRAEAVGEYRRGPEPLEDVRVGDVVPTVVKGPIGQIDMTAYYMGCPGSPGYKSCEVAAKYREWAVRDPERLPSNYDASYFSERVLPSIGHQDAAAAHELGMPGAYNNGPQRVGWFAHAVTNWMGDGAFLHKLDVRLNRPEVFGDVVRIGGEVSEVSEVAAGSVPRILLGLRATNQLGEVTATGTAEVHLDDYGRRHPVSDEQDRGLSS
jgi:acyl dehydratase